MRIDAIFLIVVILVVSFFAFMNEAKTPIAGGLAELSLKDQVIHDKCTLDGIIPEVIARGETDTTEWHGRFDVPDSPYIWEPANHNEQILTFREAIRERLGADINSRDLIERQRAIFQTLSDEWSGEASNSALLLGGEAGTITDMSCLETMLWAWQDARYPMLDHPTEFGAFVLQGDGEVRVYLSSADLVGGRVNREVTEQMQADILAGFRLITHIHNHPFLFDREVGDRMWTIEATVEDIAGALAPSMSDVGFYRGFRESHGLEEAWITNGFQSSRFSSGEFDVLIAR
jgi:hypothetical protein